MKTKGKMWVSPLMYQMKQGQKGFLHANAVTLTDNGFYIDTRSSVSEIKNSENNHIIPIERTGPNKDDFEIDFNILYYFYNQKLSEKEKKMISEDSYIIGPYEVETEIYQPMDSKQSFPRMDLDELMNALVVTNQRLFNSPKHKTYLEDRNELRKFFKEKLSVLSLVELESLVIEFSPLNEEDSENGNMLNYTADEKILKFVTERIEKLKTESKTQKNELDKMSADELNNELAEAINSANYERAAKIRDILAGEK